MCLLVSFQFAEYNIGHYFLCVVQVGLCDMQHSLLCFVSLLFIRTVGRPTTQFETAYLSSNNKHSFFTEPQWEILKTAWFENMR